MPKITDIKPQAKRTDRVSIFVDRKYALSLSLFQLSNANLKIGDELDQSRVDELKVESKVGKLYDRLLMWIALRPRSEWEISDYLKRKSDDEELVSLAIKKAKADGYVNDQSFAQRWVENRRQFKPMSTIKLKQELIKKRVPQEIIETTLQQDETDDVDTIKEVIRKRAHRYKDEQKLMGYLARQGYKYGTIKDALNEIKEEE